MTISVARAPGQTQWAGLSTDTKPISGGLSPTNTFPQPNDLFWETDTNNLFIYANNAWVLYRPVGQVVQPAVAQQVATIQTFSSNGVSVAQNTVLMLIADITPYTYFSIDNASGFNVGFQVSQDGTNFRDVAAFDSSATTGTGTTAILLATAKLWTRGIKGIQARILAKDVASQIYALSTITLAAGVGGY